MDPLANTTYLPAGQQLQRPPFGVAEIYHEEIALPTAPDETSCRHLGNVGGPS